MNFASWQRSAVRMRQAVGLVWCATLISSLSAWAAHPVEGGKVFSGDEGLEVTIVTLTPRSDNKALLQFKGTDSDLDGKVLLHDVEGDGDRVSYKTQIRGRNFVTIAVRGSYGSRTYELNVPGQRRDIYVEYDDKKTKALKADDVAVLYEKETKDGSLTKLQAFDRKGEEEAQEKQLKDLVVALNDACGTKLATTIEWKSIPDDLLKSYSISSYCGNPVEALRNLCSVADARAVIREKVKKLTCRFGKGMQLSVKSGWVTWTTDKDSTNQEEFAKTYFEKNL